MSSDRFDVVVAEYLREVEQRLSGLPVLQRRELLGDLEAHIANERAESGVSSETELLQVLERLGAPEVVASAAYEEAGLPEPTMPVPVVSVGAVPMPDAVAAASGGQVFAGTVTFAASSRFSGRAERTAFVDTSEVAAMVAASDPAAPAAPASGAPASGAPASPGPFSSVAAVAAPGSAPPAWVPPAPTPQAYQPPPSPAVIPPPDDLLRKRPGPYPPSGPGRASAGAIPGSSQPGYSSGVPPFGQPPYVGGPPLAPPPARSGSSLGWLRAAIAGVAVLFFLVALSCVGGAFLMRSGSVEEAPAVGVPVQTFSQEATDEPTVADTTDAVPPPGVTTPPTQPPTPEAPTTPPLPTATATE
ncbi:HAAS signaling domain-containing protein [Pseudosporangium ferrugineum]|uniref:Uncharacterized protein n=1 Tax=Pseudosporangium ferrugineum TaxID=439699 RepID=A0A2T0S7T5_9ACTN|nr:hypothetical protein [Pseudosporangium ferrugineum]PRY29478.1 hypothetical protein CLV70_106197 [Pseudosporangium ferrugineum]